VVGGERVVAIDGPAGSGKSTLAKALADLLGLPYVNTGLMYRAVTLRALRANLDLDDGPGLEALASEIVFELDPKSSPVSLLIDGDRPCDELTSAEVEREVSRVARHPGVRRVMRVEQRRLGEGGAVMEGRDIGTAVFPDAALKVFLQAARQERIVRRVLEREGAGAEGELAEALIERDAEDARVNPFIPAADAVAIDTTDKRPDEVLREVLALAHERLGQGR
jgi:cytidylate kinase